MKFEVKKTGYNIEVLTPTDLSYQLSGLDTVVYKHSIIGNGSSFNYLQKLFFHAAEMKTNQIIRIPSTYKKTTKYEKIWAKGVFGLDIVLINYFNTHNDTEYIDSIENENIDINAKYYDYLEEKKDFPNILLTNGKIRTVRKDDTIYIYGNKNMFYILGIELKNLIALQDNVDNNLNYHIHYKKNSSNKDVAEFAFFYYHKE